MHTLRSVLQHIGYRLGQVRQQLGFVSPLSAEELSEIADHLPPPAYRLFLTMTEADRRHSLRVYQGLLKHGCLEDDLLRAALLHDVGKAAGRVPFWTRPVIVLGKSLAPRLLRRLLRYPEPSQPRWQRALGYAWWHAEVGARLAEEAGLSERAALYIRTHHQPTGPAAALHLVDEAS